MPIWFVPVFIALALLSFIMTPPTFLANRFVAKFAVHPKIQMRSSIYINGTEITGDAKERFIEYWNDARFQDRLYGEIPDTSHLLLRLSVHDGQRESSFALFSSKNYIDVVKQTSRRKTLAYRVRGQKLQDYVNSVIQKHDVEV